MGPTAGVAEDAFNTGHLDHHTGAIILDGPWWFGGFSCGIDPMHDGIIPFAGFEITLYGPTGGSFCKADLNDDDELDFLDIQIFVSQQTDYNADESFDFLDISAFVRDLMQGCSR